MKVIMISPNLHVLQVGHMVGYHRSLASTIGLQASLIIFCTKPHSDFNLLQAWATFQRLISICAVLYLVIQSHLILWDPMDGIFVTPWTVAHQSLLSMGILQARILE